MASAQVALVRCETYDSDAVNAAVERGLDLLGGAQRFVRADERILLKPNLLVASAPEASVTTHPAVFSAAAHHLRKAGANLVYGDSPGFGRGEGAAKRGGLQAVAQEMSIPFADFAEGSIVSFPEGALIKQFTIANGVLEADGLVSLSKLKSHGLTRMTGAVKNQFGCIPGMLKGEFHARMPDIDRFSQMLVDLNRLLVPRLYIMDGIVAMEGNGPRNGDPRPMNVILFSDDPVALDATVCRMMNLDPELVGTVTYGQQFGLGTYTDIEIVGDSLKSFVADDFAVNRSTGSTTGGSGRASRIMNRLVTPKPVISKELCTACGTCVKVCPVDPKAVDWATPEGAKAKLAPVHDYDRCIRCYCCQELCPESAIKVETPLLGRLIHRERRAAE
ncbi:MAG: DUF362 domain-containing protein [Actinomycetota bacterium]|jgi:uncharacterized protein (DUF362 family)/ferredoxin|nr:DUF362 domain-containing protein [Actinomycetota bacterium]